MDLVEWLQTQRAGVIFSLLVGFAAALMLLQVCTNGCLVVGATAFSQAPHVRNYLQNGTCVQYIPVGVKQAHQRNLFVNF